MPLFIPKWGNLHNYVSNVFIEACYKNDTKLYQRNPSVVHVHTDFHHWEIVPSFFLFFQLKTENTGNEQLTYAENTDEEKQMKTKTKPKHTHPRPHPPHPT